MRINVDDFTEATPVDIQALMEEIHTGEQELAVASESYEMLVKVQSALTATETVSKTANALAETITAHALERAGVVLSKASTESVVASTVALEFVGAALTAIWDQIVKIYKSVSKAVRKFFFGSGKAKKKNNAQLKKLQKELEKMSDELDGYVNAQEAPKPIENKELLAAFIIPGKEVGIAEDIMRFVASTRELVLIQEVLSTEILNLSIYMEQSVNGFIDDLTIGGLGVSREAIRSNGVATHIFKDITAPAAEFIGNALGSVIDSYTVPLTVLERDQAESVGAQINDIDYQNSRALQSLTYNSSLYVLADKTTKDFPLIAMGRIKPAALTSYYHFTFSELMEFTAQTVTISDSLTDIRNGVITRTDQISSMNAIIASNVTDALGRLPKESKSKAVEINRVFINEYFTNITKYLTALAKIDQNLVHGTKALTSMIIDHSNYYKGIERYGHD